MKTKMPTEPKPNSNLPPLEEIQQPIHIKPSKPRTQPAGSSPYQDPPNSKITQSNQENSQKKK
jgi:hypothetical protein